jgi:hypothetical protein
MVLSTTGRFANGSLVFARGSFSIAYWFSMTCSCCGAEPCVPGAAPPDCGRARSVEEGVVAEPPLVACVREAAWRPWPLSAPAPAPAAAAAPSAPAFPAWPAERPAPAACARGDAAAVVAPALFAVCLNAGKAKLGSASSSSVRAWLRPSMKAETNGRMYAEPIPTSPAMT